MSKVFNCVLEQTRYFNVEADSEEQMMEWLQTHDFNDVDNLTKDYHDAFDERIIDFGKVDKANFSIATQYYPVYSKDGDITFIMRKVGNMLSVSGFYFGEPNAEDIEIYKDKGVDAIV